MLTTVAAAGRIFSSFGKKLINPQTVNTVTNIVGTGAAVVAGATAGAGLAAPPSQSNLVSTSSDNLFYPEDLESYKYYITFGFVQYQRRSILDLPFLNPKGNIRLPIPSNIVDQLRVEYREDGLNPLAGAGMELGLKGGGNFGGAAGVTTAAGLAGALNSTVSALGGANLGPGYSALASGLKSAGSAAPFALQPFGLAVNPFLTVLFKSPTFKRHAFSWRLSANSPKESETINNILKAFRSHMLPSAIGWTGGAILRYPDMCTVTFNPSDDWLYKFKPCVVESVSMNFAPNQQASFFNETDAPTDILFTVNLLETEYWLRENIY